MGYDIYVYDPEDLSFNITKKTVTVNRRYSQQHLYVSYNWGDMGNYWAVNENMSGKQGKEILPCLGKAIDELHQMKVPRLTTLDDPTNRNLAWGCDSNEKRLDQDTRLAVFLFILRGILPVVEDYPDSYFVSDRDNAIIKDGVTYSVITKRGSDNDSD
jgi:hypothetical protein